MELILDIQNEYEFEVPSKEELENWIRTTFNHSDQIIKADICVRIVDESECSHLNETYRKKKGPTNVLTFPYGNHNDEHKLQGDIVVCAPVVAAEAAAHKKSTTAHWTHMIVHSILHLLGYDHTNDADAETMESLEIKILNSLNISNPYEENVNS